MPQPNKPIRLPDRDNPAGRGFANYFSTPKEPDLAHEIEELRREIISLREELKQVPSLILTGKEVLEEFQRIVSG